MQLCEVYRFPVFEIYQIYAPTPYHAMNTAKGSVVGGALKGAPISSALEFARAAALGGATLSDKRVKEVMDAVSRADTAARAGLDGLLDASGPMRIEVTYAVHGTEQTTSHEGMGGERDFVRGMLEYMLEDVVYGIAGIGENGRMSSEAFYALEPRQVHALAMAEATRCLEVMKHGIVPAGHDLELDADLAAAQLPLGHLASIGERCFLDGALVNRSSKVGPALRRGQKMFGVSGENNVFSARICILTLE